MADVLVQIKNEIIRLLKQLDPEVDVYFEEIKSTDTEHGATVPETYYFVDMVPGSSTVDRVITDKGILVDVAYHEKEESSTAYLLKTEKLDGLFRPVFSFGDRHITVPAVNHRIVDHVLHTSFTLSFRHAEEAQDHEMMEGLDMTVTGTGRGAEDS
ncbi:phage tail terminator family protein [Acetatifactor muris]|uniref:phage tail terminator family protein n=1 Tax=Acetatifactor muris TaxID=879566 RepID=UPI0023F27378|nr:translation initiation factor 2 [Acetatifactor muris]